MDAMDFELNANCSTSKCAIVNVYKQMINHRNDIEMMIVWKCAEKENTRSGLAINLTEFPNIGNYLILAGTLTHVWPELNKFFRKTRTQHSTIFQMIIYTFAISGKMFKPRSCNRLWSSIVMDLSLSTNTKLMNVQTADKQKKWPPIAGGHMPASVRNCFWKWFAESSYCVLFIMHLHFDTIFLVCTLF